MKSIMDIAVKIFCYILLNTMNKLQFTEQLKETEDDFNDLVFFVNVLCLSWKSLQRLDAFLTPKFSRNKGNACQTFNNQTQKMAL